MAVGVGNDVLLPASAKTKKATNVYFSVVGLTAKLTSSLKAIGGNSFARQHSACYPVIGVDEVSQLLFLNLKSY